MSSTPLRVCVLGSTGSVGANTLDVIARHPGRFEVFALTGASRIDELAAQCIRWKPRFAAMPDAARAAELRDRLAREGVRTEVLAGARALEDLAAHPDVDAVMAAIVGAAGLEPTLAAARAGKRILLANKESMVCAGALLMDAADAAGAVLLPIDSEHNAIFQCLPAGHTRPPAGVRQLWLTASGGPFRASRCAWWTCSPPSARASAA